MAKSKNLRQLLKQPGAILMPVAHDALTAKLIEQAGFEAYSVGGFGIAASSYGLPDTGVLARGELAPVIKNILHSSSLPALVDADTGYGNEAAVARTVQEYEDLGAAAIFIEDQVWPKRCGHFGAKKLVSVREMNQKIKAALKAKRDPDLLIMARTDARHVYSLEKAIKRAKAYIQAGAESIFIEAPRTVGEIRTIPQTICKVPLLINMMESGKTPLMTKEELEKLGYKMIAYPISTLLTMTKAVSETLAHLKIHGTTNDYFKHNMVSLEQFKQIIGLDKTN